tara:strand:+ start:320 stop:1054 length:735 start_codon:yes stop_codon:yes gene_type:complete
MDNHVITMVFNLVIKDKPNMYEGENSWLRQRLDIFKKYCISSFANQTDPDFHLFLFCDKHTPTPYKEELLELESQYKFITIIWDFTYAEGHGTTYEEICEKVIETYKEVRNNDSDDIICSRFENDDIPEIRYNAFVKLAVETNPIISLGKGLYWDINTDEFLDSVFPAGPFISTKSKIDDFKAPFELNHHDMISKRNGQPIITNDNTWIQLVHGENLWNRLDRMPGNKMEKPSDEYLKTYFSYE